MTKITLVFAYGLLLWCALAKRSRPGRVVGRAPPLIACLHSSQNLVDLAGSERVSDTGAEGTLPTSAVKLRFENYYFACGENSHLWIVGTPGTAGAGFVRAGHALAALQKCHTAMPCERFPSVAVSCRCALERSWQHQQESSHTRCCHQGPC